MKKVLLLALLLFGLVGGVVRAVECNGNQECLDLQGEINKLSDEVSVRSEANEKNAEELRGLQSKVRSLQNQVSEAEKELDNLEESLRTREKEAGTQYEVLAIKTREFYKSLRGKSLLSFLFSSLDAGEINRDLAYRFQTQDQDRQIILQISKEIVEIEKDKVELEERKGYLSSLSSQLDKQADFLAGEVAGVSNYISSLQGKIAALSTKQQSILSEKAGTFQTTVGDVPLADDPNSRPDYNPGFSPAFAAFSFGAPHFKGMSQYGAFGRAKDGQSYEEILKAYYGSSIEIRTVDGGTKITVDGYGSYSIDEYAKRIYEMPGSWGDQEGMEALKAQAVAARSYALARGGSICATEHCQVFKPGPKGGNWERAVNETSNKVVYANGAPLSTWYASTSGGYQESYTANGYSTPGFWDTANGGNNGRDGWTSEAYEKKGGSPWFYKGWYKTRSGDSCGRSHPWLTGEEMADVINAWVALYQGGGDSSRVTPESGCWGGNPYSKADLQGLGGYSSVSGVSVQYANNGVTANVTFQTNKGSKTIDGLEFKKAFNLRAPGRIALKSGLFNIEQK
jgi:peptidoglycan hydrolase CwlO-like protein